MLSRRVDRIPEVTEVLDSDYLLMASGNVFKKINKANLGVGGAGEGLYSSWILRDGTVSPYSANSGDRLLIDSNNDIDIYLPSDPAFGDEITLLKASEHNVSIKGSDGGRFLFKGLTEELKLSAQYKEEKLVYLDSETGWISNDFQTILDPYRRNVKLMLYGEESSGNYVDSSGNWTIDTFGSVPRSSSVKKFGTQSIDFSANDFSNYLRTSTDFVTLGVSDFTIDFWCYPLSFASSFSICGQSDTGWVIGNFGGQLAFWRNGHFAYGMGEALPLNQWSHFAVTRKAETIYLFLNGSLKRTYSIGSRELPAGKLYLGKTIHASQKFHGYLDNFRFTDVAKWTSTTYELPTELTSEL